MPKKTTKEIKAEIKELKAAMKESKVAVQSYLQGKSDDATAAKTCLNSFIKDSNKVVKLLEKLEA